MKVEKSPTLSASAGKSNGKTKRGFLSASGTNGSQSSSLFPANSIAQVEGASIIPPSEQLKFEGYCAKTGGKYLYYLAVLFSLGLVWLINRWYPDLSVKISNTRCQLRDAEVVVVIRPWDAENPMDICQVETLSMLDPCGAEARGRPIAVTEKVRV